VGGIKKLLIAKDPGLSLQEFPETAEDINKSLRLAADCSNNNRTRAVRRWFNVQFFIKKQEKSLWKRIVFSAEDT
jgi:hypothetical protein